MKQAMFVKLSDSHFIPLKIHFGSSSWSQPTLPAVSHHEMPADVGLEDPIEGALGEGTIAEWEEMRNIALALLVVSGAYHSQVCLGFVVRFLSYYAGGIKHLRHRHSGVVARRVARVRDGVLVTLRLTEKSGRGRGCRFLHISASVQHLSVHRVCFCVSESVHVCLFLWICASVSVHVCLFMHVILPASVFLCLFLFVFVSLCLFLCICVCVCLSLCLLLCVCVRLCVSVYVYLCIRFCVFVSVYVYLCIRFCVSLCLFLCICLSVHCVHLWQIPPAN